MINIEEARSIILDSIAVLPPEMIHLTQGLGRVICDDIFSPVDIPLTDNSAMDGYAFSHAAVQHNRLKVAGFLPAGRERTVPVVAGEAIRIMTGAPIPPGCDTVVPFEDVEECDGEVRLVRDVAQGSHIRRRGEDIGANSKVAASGAIIRPQEIGMLLSLGLATVKVYRKARVAILATGDELLGAGATPVPGRIVNSNSYSIAAQVLEAGGDPVLLGIARDDRDITRAKIMEGLCADMIITTGGVSVGDRDFVKDAIQDLGGEILFWKVNMKPGKPVAYAVLENKPVFALPGNPVSSMVAFEMFVRSAMLRLMGQSRILRPAIRAEAITPLRNRGERPQIMMCNVQLRNGRYFVSAAESQSSANMLSFSASNALAQLAPGESVAAGDEVIVTLLDRGFEMGEYDGCH